MTGAKVAVSGRISTASKHGKGGVVILTANEVKIGSHAKLDASGATGGTLLIGGDVHGGADPSADFSITPVTNALTTTIAAGATLTANGTAGQGGNIVVWSNDLTRFAGAISAQGTTTGGFAEVSGKKLLAFTGTVDLTGPDGAGTLLLDPDNITISSGASSSIALDAYNIGFFSTGANSILGVGDLQYELGMANVIVSTDLGGVGSQAGDITVADPVTWSNGHSLTLLAHRNITINAAITNTGGANIVLHADNANTGTGLVAFGSGGQISTSGAVSIFYTPAGNDNTTVNPTSYTNAIDFSGNVTGGGTLASYMLVSTLFDLQNMQNNLSGSYALASNIDASGTASWNGGAGFVPVGNSTTAFTGKLNGQGHTITGLTIDRPTTDDVGLFGYTGTGASIDNLTLADVNIAGHTEVAGLVGYNNGGVTNVSVSGSVTGGLYDVGGVAGTNDTGSISEAQSSASVSGSTQVGGLVGSSRGTISQSFATGSVRASPSGGNAGGLVGTLSGDVKISDSYSTASVSGGGDGGLIGRIYTGTPTLTNVWSSGAVSGAVIGGVIGQADSSPNMSGVYWDKDTTGMTVACGSGTCSGATGMSTTNLQQAALPNGFSNSVWGVVAGQSYPYLLWQYPASGGTPQVISGYARNGKSAATGAVSALVNGTGVGSAAVGANGYYNILIAPGTIRAGSQVAAYTSGADAGVSYQQDASSSVTSLGIYAGFLTENTSATTLSAISPGLAIAIGSSGVSTTFANRNIVASGASFTIDQAITQSGTLSLQAAGDVTQAPGAAIKAAELVLRENSGGGSYTLRDSGNAIGTLFANWSIGSGGVSLYDSTDLSVKNGSSLAADGSVLIQTAGALTLNGSITSNASGNAIVLVAGTTFTNNAGAAALSTPNGRFLVYSQNSANDNVGGLAGGSIYNATYTGNPPASISASGNQFVYANAASKMLITYLVYDSPNNYYGTTATTGQAILAGVKNGDSVTAVVSVYDSNNNLITLGADTPAGTYKEVVTGLTGADANQYQIASGTNGTLIINKASLTVYVGSATKTYGATTYNGQPTYVPSGIKTGDTITSLDFASPGLAATAGVGNYTLTASNAQGTGLSNYNITYQAGSLSVAQASLTIASGGSVAASKVYDGSTAATVTGNGTLSGVLNSDDVSLALGGTNYSDANVGTSKTVTGTYSLTGAAARNYILLSSKSFTGTAAITQKTLTVATAGSVQSTKTYDGTTAAAVTGDGTLNGVISGDNVTLALSGTTYGDKNVGAAKTVTGTYSLSGTGVGNYKLDSTAFTTTAAITPKTLTISAVTDTKTYDGGTASTAAPIINGLVSGDTASATQAFDSKNAGARTLSISGYNIKDGNGGGNYVVDNSGTAAGTIKQATLTISAVTDTKTYDGGTASSAAPTIAGLVSGDTASATQTFDSKNAGVRTLSISGYNIKDGNGGNNYVVDSSGTASGVIGKANLTISAVTDSKTYDGTTASTKAPTITGLQVGDSVSATQVFDSPNAGARVLSVSSNYTIDDGNNGNNYVVSSGNQAQGTISRALLTVTASNQEKMYGTAYDLGSTAFTTSGTLYGSDKITGVTLTSYGARATAAAGADEIDANNATGSGLNNYAITYVAGSLKVDQAPLTITVNDRTKTYGQSVAFGSGDYTVTGKFYNGDSISSVYLSSPGQYTTATVAGGPYAITASNANGPGSYNYAITYVSGKLTVDPARITAIASAQDKTYDGTTAATGSITGFNGDRQWRPAQRRQRRGLHLRRQERRQRQGRERQRSDADRRRRGQLHAGLDRVDDGVDPQGQPDHLGGDRHQDL